MKANRWQRTRCGRRERAANPPGLGVFCQLTCRLAADSGLSSRPPSQPCLPRFLRTPLSEGKRRSRDIARNIAVSILETCYNYRRDLMSDQSGETLRPGDAFDAICLQCAAEEQGIKVHTCSVHW
jgi:hypothetical protein